ADAIGVAERKARQRLARIDFEQRDVRRRIAADDLGRNRVSAASVLIGAEVHVHFRRALHDVVVGQNVAVWRDDEARTAAALGVLIIAAIGTLLTSGPSASLSLRIGKEKLEGIDAEAAASQVARFHDLRRG